MSYDKERAYIMQYLQNHANYASLGTVFFENLPRNDMTNKEYCYAAIMNFSRLQISNGGSTNLYRAFGALQVEIKVPENTGLTSALRKADTISEMFKNKNLVITTQQEWINFEVPEVFRGQSKDGRTSVFVRCPFYRNEYL